MPLPLNSEFATLRGLGYERSRSRPLRDLGTWGVLENLRYLTDNLSPYLPISLSPAASFAMPLRLASRSPNLPEYELLRSVPENFPQQY